MLPPFSSNLKNFLASGRKPSNDIYFFCGINAWRKAKYFSRYRFTLCLPPFLNPAIYKWPVQGCSVLLFETGNLETNDIEEIAFYLLGFGASIVRAVNNDYELAIFCGESYEPVKR